MFWIFHCGFQLDSGGYLRDGFLVEAQQSPPSLMLRSRIDLIAPEFRNEEAQRNLQSMQYRPDVQTTAVSTGNGIKIRSRHPKSQQNAPNVVAHGTAPRRIRLQISNQVGSNYSSLIDKNAEVEPSVIEVKYFLCLTSYSMCDSDLHLIEKFRKKMPRISKLLLVMLLQMLFLLQMRLQRTTIRMNKFLTDRV